MLSDTHHGTLTGAPREARQHQGKPLARHPRLNQANSAWFVFVPAGFFSALAGVIENSPAIPIFTCFILGITLIILRSVRLPPDDRNVLMEIFAWGFLIRIIFAIALYYYLISFTGEPYLGGGDDSLYELIGEQYLARLKILDLPINRLRHPGYPLFLAILRQFANLIGGYHGLLSRIANAAFGGLICSFIYILCLNIFSKNIAKLSALLTILFPSFIFYSAVQLRDVIIAFLFVYAMAQFSIFYKFGKSSGLFHSTLACVIMLYFRTQYSFLLFSILFLCLSMSMLFDKSNMRTYRWQKLMILSLVFCCIYYISSHISIGKGFDSVTDESSYHMSVFEEGHIESRVMAQRDRALGAKDAEGGLGYALISHLPLGSGYIIMPTIAFIMPYPPWTALQSRSENPLRFIYFINAVSWTLLMPLCLLGIAYSIPKNWVDSLIILIPMILILAVSSIGGFQYRYKLPSLIFSMPFVSIAIIGIRNNLINYGYAFWGLMQTSLILAYLIAKVVF